MCRVFAYFDLSMARNFQISISLRAKLCLWSYLELVCDQYDRFSSELPLYAFFKNMFPHVGIDSRERIIKQEDVSIRVDSPRQADPLLLTP